jgi:SAM-dependent methyltransferase
VLGALKKFYRRQQFEPGWIGLWINPFFPARRALARHLRDLGSRISGRTLDVGCGQKPYESFFQSSEYIGIELDTPDNRTYKKADRYYDGKTFPFSAGEFDSVVSNQVLEHVLELDLFLDEIHRVLKPDGLLLLTVPFMWDEHEQPVDFGRYSSFGLEYILKKHDFEVLEHRKSVTDIRAVFQLINAYLAGKTFTRNQYLNLATAFFLLAPFNICGELLARILPPNENLYLDNVVLARKRPAG